MPASGPGSFSGMAADPVATAASHNPVLSTLGTAVCSGQDFKVNGKASVICGNVQTSNATVYIIDTVLMPPAAK